MMPIGHTRTQQGDIGHRTDLADATNGLLAHIAFEKYKSCKDQSSRTPSR